MVGFEFYCFQPAFSLAKWFDPGLVYHTLTRVFSLSREIYLPTLVEEIPFLIGDVPSFGILARENERNVLSLGRTRHSLMHPSREASAAGILIC